MRSVLFLLLLLTAATAAGAARTLYWRTLDVDAVLDRDGRLHVRERHGMVFSGAWNGGERRFRVETGQRLQLVGVSQIDPASGASHPLKPGGLSAVGQYKWFDGHVLRWRSRLPGDPPFRDTELVYEIEYVLSNILQPRDGSFVLDHDFAFPQRDGRIAHYTLNFRWDDVWRSDTAFTGHLELSDLAPGRGVVLTIPFRYAAAGAPAGVRWPLAREWRYALLLVLAGFIGWRVYLFQRHERRQGRYARPLAPARIDTAWLEKNIFCLAPEVAGAAWDKTTAAPEVAAVLARMTLEGKLASEVQRTGFWWSKRNVLHLRLLRKREDLAGHEQRLVAALFMDGDTTDTDRIRDHYRQRGFNPADTIRATLAERVKRLRGGDSGKPTFHLSLALSFGALLTTTVGMLLDTDRAVFAAVATGIGCAVYVVAMVSAWNYDRHVIEMPTVGFYYFIPQAALVGGLGYVALATDLIFGAWTLLGLGLWCATFANSQLNLMRTRDTAAFTGLRKRLAAARRYFQCELRAARPRLQDAWLPYLLAFGLGQEMDKWFRTYPVPGSGPADSPNGTPNGTPGAGGVSGWSGGGGTFAGAGATGAWVAAVGGMAASIPTPSSDSGGSGGGGGGGGSSGGGGGGGW